MALPPPLPARVPPPLPSRGPAPPPLPGQSPLSFAPDPEDRFLRHRGRDVDTLFQGGRFFGQWIAVNSTWLYLVRFDVETDTPIRHRSGQLQIQSRSIGGGVTGTMRIEFVSGAICRYDNFPTADYMDLITSSSKGRYVYYQIKQGKVPYTLERGPTRSPEQVRALVKARQPRTAFQRARYYNVGGKRRAGGGVPSR